ncbi:MAG: ribonuclease HII [Pseudomarimonas sp.]
MNASYRALTPDAGIAGVDEAGRGPLAGPLMVAAVILDPARPVPGIDDSKRLSQSRREALFELIINTALCWHIERVEPAQIDRINILQATLQGMRECLRRLSSTPTLALIDGNRLPLDLPCAARAIVRGDALEPAIGAASILAKVSRDRAMVTLHQDFPGYGFDAHKGYPTPLHFLRLRELGPCSAHRFSFAPVRQASELALDLR